MAESNEMEIYKQRYETFRHLDGMRYQVQNITILVGTLFAGYITNQEGAVHPIFGLVVGSILVTFAFTMRRVSKGIVANSKVLKTFGEKIGDTTLPEASMSWKTATYWSTLITFFIGAGLILYSGCRFHSL
jgi:hypothetical protein